MTSILPPHNYILDFSRDYPPDYGTLLDAACPPERVDLSAVSGTHLYCGPEAGNAIAAAVHARGTHGIHFIDTGDYHYVTKFMADEIRESFCLIQIDHHTDLQPGAFDAADGSTLSCGSWVRSVLQTNPFLQRLLLIGPPAESIRAAKADPVCQTGIRDGKILCISSEDLAADLSVGGTVFSAIGTAIISPPHEVLSPYLSINGVPSSVAPALFPPPDTGLPIYLSIDRDILCRKDAVTDWDQGDMTLSDLTGLLRRLLTGRRLLGADLCGGLSASDASPEAAAVNLRCDRALYHLLCSCFSSSQ